MTSREEIDGYDEYGVPYSAYPDCEHGDIEPGERCTTCAPSAVKQQRLIDADPEAYETAVEAMLEEAMRHDDEATWRAEP